MPTYNRDFIIKLAIQSIINQKDHSWQLELLIGDDGDDQTEDAVASLENTNPLLEIKYFKLNRIPLSDKRNFLVKQSTGSYFGIVDSDDIQSPYKVAAFEKALEENPKANLFGQRSFLYHDIVFGRTVRWIQNRDMTFFKAGSFIILKRETWDQTSGYPPGLWRSVDSSFATVNDHSLFHLCELDTYHTKLTDTSIALQHISNIWKRKNKGFRFKRPKQLRNYMAEPIDCEPRKMFDVNFQTFIEEEQNIRARYYVNHWNPLIHRHYKKKLRIGTPNVLQVERTKNYYDKKYTVETSYSAKAYTPVYVQAITLLNDLKLDNPSILEVGCGDGLLANMLHKAGYTNYHGIDISESGIAQAKKSYPYMAGRFSLGDAYDSKQDTDIVIAIEVLEHIDDMKFITSLKPGTLLLASVPNYWSTNNEHLRIYKSRNHIKWRFRKLLEFIAWSRIQRTETRKVYVFTARVK